MMINQQGVAHLLCQHVVNDLREHGTDTIDEPRMIKGLDQKMAY